MIKYYHHLWQVTLNFCALVKLRLNYFWSNGSGFVIRRPRISTLRAILFAQSNEL